MGVDFCNYQVFCGEVLESGRSQLIEQIQAAMFEIGMQQENVDRSQIDYILQTQRTTRAFAIGPKGKWITVLDSLSSVYGEPHFDRNRGDYYTGDPLIIPEPDLYAEKLRQHSCEAFLKSISKTYPSIWLTVLDGMGLNGQLYFGGQVVGSLKCPVKVNGTHTALTQFEDNSAWPASARLPSLGDSLGLLKYDLEDDLKIARFIGWHDDSVKLGFTIDHEGMDWEFSVPNSYDLLLFDQIK